MTTATTIIQSALRHMQDRAATYDKPEGERSMGATVAAFKAVSGHALTEEQGWLFMALLKSVRSQQGVYRADSYEDGAAYFALAGEAAARDRAPAPPGWASGGWMPGSDPSDFQRPDPPTTEQIARQVSAGTGDFDEAVVDRVASSHGDGEHYDDQEWIETDGIRSPHVDKSAMPLELLHRDGTSSYVPLYLVMRDDAKQGHWKHTGSACDIIAWRPASNAP